MPTTTPTVIIKSGYYYENGLMFNEDSGEVVDTITATMPIGTVAYTPADQQAYKKRKQKEQHKNNREKVNAALGAFYFANKNDVFDGLSPATVARLFYLCSFNHYNSDKLMRNINTPIYRKDLSGLLHISPAAVKQFLDKVSPKYIRIEDDNTIFYNKDIFSVGKKRMSEKALKIYKKGIRALYESVEITEHKHLGYIFALLPYVNTEYNVICRNPDEKDLDEIEPISLKEFCAMIGFDGSHLNRLKKIYGEIKFNIDGEQKRFVAFVNDGTDINRSVICINPRVLYSGSDYTKVEVYALFFR